MVSISNSSFLFTNIAPLVLLIAVLSRLHPLLHLHGRLSALFVILQTAVDNLALPADRPHRADNSRGSGTESLDEPALLGSLRELGHGVLALDNLPTLGSQLLL